MYEEKQQMNKTKSINKYVIKLQKWGKRYKRRTNSFYLQRTQKHKNF